MQGPSQLWQIIEVSGAPGDMQVGGLVRERLPDRSRQCAIGQGRFESIF